MRRRVRPNRASSSARAVRALLAMLALLAAIALPAHAQDPQASEQIIRIELPDGARPFEIPWSMLSGATQTKRIELPGGVHVDRAVVTLEQVLNKVQMTSDRVSSIGLVRADGAPMTISRVQLTEYYPDPLLYLDDDGVLNLLRSKLVGSPAAVARAIDGVLTLSIGSEPQVTAHPEWVDLGHDIVFTVTIPLDIEDPSRVTYVWDFNDDTPVVEHRSNVVRRIFKKPGVYNVVVNYKVDGQLWTEGGLAPSVAVRIRAPSVPSDDRSARKSDRRARRRSDTGGDDDETVDPDAGTGSGLGDASGSGTGGSGGTGTGGWDVPAAASTPPPPAPKPRAERRAPPRRATPPEPVGETVEGYLLAAADVPLPTGGAVRAAAAEPPALDDDGPLEIPTAAWVVIGVLGLGVLGWTLESRTTLPYFKP